MTDEPTHSPPGEEEIPPLQALLDRPFVLLAAGLAVMLLFYTGWGLIEVLTLTDAPLP